MGFLTRLLAGTPSADDDFWYKPLGMTAAAGVVVDTETAQKVSAFYAGVRLLANDVAKLPLDLYQRDPDGGKTRARFHPLYDVLHTQPNAWQTSFEWRRQGVRHLILRGNWYNRIIPGRRGAVDQLLPIPPELVKPVQLSSGRIAYLVRNAGSNEATTYTQDDIFHVRGVSDDGIEGKSVLTWARDSIGLAIAQGSYASRLFSQGSLHSGVISVPSLLDPEASKRMAESWVTSEQDWHKPKVLEQGATYQESEMSPQDFQMLASQQFSVTEMARWLGIPPHKIADLTRSTNNNIEHQGLEYVTDSLSPWLVLIEQAILRDLIAVRDKYFAEFNVDALMRGDSAARGEFYSKMFSVGAYSPNDILAKENMNKVEGGDQRFVPANMRPIDAPYDSTAAGAGGPGGTPPPGRATTTAQALIDNRARLIAMESAARLLRKERAAMSHSAIKFASDSPTWRKAVTAFYASHVELVKQTMQIEDTLAQFYCDGHRDAVLADGIGAVDGWTPDHLVGLALDGVAA